MRSPTVLKHLSQVDDSSHHRTICLTFDDGPDPAYTPSILDILAHHGCRATFFVLGQAAEQHPRLLERIAADGHAIGNHTYSHRHPWTLSPGDARQEIARASDVIRDITGKKPRWFRPPHGRLRRAMLDQAGSEQMRTVLWSRSAIDWGFLGSEAGIARRLRAVKAGDIILMHDGRRQHNRPDRLIGLLPDLLEEFRHRALEPVTLDQVA